MSDSINKHAHGRHPVAVTYTSNLYEALTDGLGRSIPFQINAAVGGIVRVLLSESDDYVDMYFNPGDNPSLVIGIDDRGAMSTNLVALYPYIPASTTINTTY